MSAGKSRPSWNERPDAVARAPVRRQVGEVDHRSVAGPERDRAGVGRDEARQHVEERGLPRAVGADEPDDLARVDGEGDRVEGHDAAEVLPDSVDHESGRTHVDLGPLRWDGPDGPRRGRVADEHRAQQVAALHQLGRRALETDLAVLEEVGAVGDAEGEVE